MPQLAGSELSAHRRVREALLPNRSESRLDLLTHSLRCRYRSVNRVPDIAQLSNGIFGAIIVRTRVHKQ
jgi:hypothetical protein